MLFEVEARHLPALYRYFQEQSAEIPFYLPVDFDHWRASMFDDRDYDGRPLFIRLMTLALEEEGVIRGFIQFGLTSYVFDENGNKDYHNSYAVIRNLHYHPQAAAPRTLLDAAAEFFTSMGMRGHHAFFHNFGMSCYAHQGKLHAAHFFLEPLLGEYGFVQEHENVYFSRSLNGPLPAPPPDIAFVYGSDGQSVTFLREDKPVGGCELFFVPGTSICFLKLIHIDARYRHQGLGTRCMNKLFIELRNRGIDRLDTDTMDSNVNAQGYYLKMGFRDLGRMRSYRTRQ